MTRVARGVAIDFHGTLILPRADAWWPQVRHHVTAAGGNHDQAAFEEWLALPLVHVEHSLDKTTYDAWSAARLARFARDSNVPDDSIEALLDRIELARQRETLTLAEGARETLEELRARGHRVVICSNWDWDLERHVNEQGLDERVDAVVCSARVGYRKPHPTIYELALEALGTAAGETLFVGDEWLPDVVGPRRAGMTPVHASWAEACTVEDHGTVPCCASFAELLALPELA